MPIDPDILCPRAPFWLFSPDPTPMRIPGSCGRYRCPMCGNRKVVERLRVAIWGGQVRRIARKIDLTLVPDDWQSARMQVRDFARRVREHHNFEWCWAIEPNPRGTGHHLHAVSHGDFLPWRQLRDLWGGRRIHIEEVQGDAVGYVQKCAKAVGYSAKNAMAHLAVNGGRCVHMSRGYLHGLSSREVLRLLASDRKWQRLWGGKTIDRSCKLIPLDEL